MPDVPHVTLRIHGIGGVPVDQVQTFLSDISNSYNSIYVFDATITRLVSDARTAREFLPDFFALSRRRYFGEFLASRFYLQEHLPYSIPPRDMVPVGNHLLLHSVSLRSPGFWDFVGKLNPLEVIRLYLNDRHERRKDREYREDAEREKLRLENELLRSKAFEARLKFLRELGMTDEELAPIKNRLIHEPLDALGIAQARRLISSAEIIESSADEVDIS